MAQTINVANIRIGMNADGGEFTRGELRSITSILKQSETPLDKFHEQMKLMDRAFKEGAINAEQFAQSEEFLAKKFGVLTYKMEEQLQVEKKLADQAIRTAEANRALAENAARLATITNASLSPVQRMAKDVKFLDDQFKAGTIDAAGYNAAIDTLAKKHGVAAAYAERAAAAEAKLAKAKAESIAAMQRGQMASEIPDPFRGWGNVDTKTQGVNGLAGALGRVGAAGLAIGAVKAIADLGQAGLKVAMAREQVQAQLEVLTGSAAAAKKLIDATVELDQKSALSAVQFQDSSKVLLGYGLSVSEVIPTLDKLSEISMGNNEKMQSLTLAFGQVRANGRLMGQEVLQMVNAGFNPLQEISRTTGESMASLRKRMEDGKVSFEEVAKAMDTATSSGGRFAGMNEKMADTTAVKLAKLDTAYQNVLGVIGKELQPTYNKALDATLFMIDEVPKSGQKVNGWWMTLTGSANDYYRQIEAANKAKKDAESLDKRAAEAEATKAKLAKERADAEERAMKGQQAAIDADNKRIDNERSTFNSRIKAISEERMKAGFGGDNERFKKAQLVDDTFGMTEGEKQQAKAAMMEMDETRRIIELNAAHASIEAANKELEIQKRVSEMKDRNFLASDSLRKEYAQLDEMFRRQLAEAGNNEKQKEGIRKRAALAEQSIMARSDFQAMQDRKNQAGQRFGDSVEMIAKNIAPALKAGSKEAAAFLLSQNADAAEKAERKKWQSDLLAETRRANEMAKEAPRLQLARN
jgi:tape measure domain-containing protein